MLKENLLVQREELAQHSPGGTEEIINPQAGYQLFESCTS